jgi:CRP-like cAMP-binding protein
MVALKPKEFFEQHLQESTFVKELPPSDAELIGRAGEYVDYAADETLFLEGDDADAMYFIVTGTIVILPAKTETQSKSSFALDRLIILENKVY